MPRSSEKNTRCFKTDQNEPRGRTRSYPSDYGYDSQSETFDSYCRLIHRTKKKNCNMNLSNLKPAEGSTKTRKRIGRGSGSGLGGTATRGHKGAKSRSGYSKKIGFEGGQMPLQRRLPKFGFKNINRVEYKAINIDVLQALATEKKLEKIDVDTLIEAGFISKKQLVKILGKGELTAKLEVAAHAFSKTAEAAIVAAGGTVVKL